MANQLMEVLFYDSNQPDLHYTAYRLHKGEDFTGIMKVRVRRGNAPYETHYCYNNVAYKTLKEVEAAFKKYGKIKREGERNPFIIHKRGPKRKYKRKCET